MDELAGLALLMLAAAALLLLILTAVLVREATHPARRTAGYALARGLPVDPADLGLPFESWSVTRAGAVLPVWDVRAPRGAAGETAIVLVHGWGQSRIDMLARAGPWRALADRVVLYDRRGHGEAGGGGSTLGGGEDEDLLALLAALEAPRVILVGYSMGAVIAIHAASRVEQRHRIAAVIAYAPYLDFHASLRGRLRSKGLPARPLTDLALLWLALRGLRPGGVLRAAEALRCPLLVIHGGLDPVTPPGHARRIAEAAPQGRYLEIARAGHLDAPDADAPQHDAAVRAFLGPLRPSVP